MVAAMAALHNFIRIYDPDDDLEPWIAEEQNNNEHRGTRSLGVSRMEIARSNKRRDEIAKAMWQSYRGIRNI